MGASPIAASDYIQIIFDRLRARDALAPYSSLIGVWFKYTERERQGNSVVTFVPAPRRLRAVTLDSTSVERASLAALHCRWRNPDRLLETRWAIPLPALVHGIWNCDSLTMASLVLALNRCVKKVAMTQEETRHFDDRVQASCWEADPEGSLTQWLDHIAMPTLRVHPACQSPQVTIGGAVSPDVETDG